jgi:hypothetical protein
MQRWVEWVPYDCPSYCLQATKALFSSQAAFLLNSSQI